MTFLRLSLLLCSALTLAACGTAPEVLLDSEYPSDSDADDEAAGDDGLSDEDTGDEDTADESTGDEGAGDDATGSDGSQGEDDDTDDQAADDEDAASEDDASEDEPSEDEVVTDPCEEDGVLCAQLVFPSQYSGNPRELAVSLYGNLPAFGPPNFVLIQDTSPSVVASGTYDIVVDSGLPSNGSYHLYAVVYDVSGGQWIPTPGVDLVAETPAITFDGSAIDAGVVTMEYSSWF
ncbi:MAG: hypothetical protein CL928_18605 [Deltaproteobacteria bacterium]|nr:hypothetical protein [Deltaproteobacteria bacterium]